MKVIPATDLRRNLFETLKRVAYEKQPLLVERRGKTIAALVPPDAVGERTHAASRGDGPLRDLRALADFCETHRLKTLYLFGSVLTDRFGADSDVDVMFESDGPSPDYFQQMRMSDELERIFGRRVDLVSKRVVEGSSNPFRKKSILESARIIYGH